MSTTIEQLELEIRSSSTSAISGIDSLSASLSKLKNAVKGGVGLRTVANQVRNLDTALKGVDGSGINKIDKLVTSLSKLKTLGKVKISPNIAKQLKNVSTVVTSLERTEFRGFDKLTTALSSLSNISSATGLNSTMRALNKLPQLAQSLNGMNWDTFTEQIERLSTSLSPLAKQLNSVSTGFDKLPSNLNKMTNNTGQLATGTQNVALSYTELYSKFKMVSGVVRTASYYISTWITTSNQYVEDLNLFTASMGQYAEEAQKYAEAVGEALGIDPGEFMRNQGTFNTIITGFGVASDKAYLMSKNLTQLGYDISSFYNISFEDAMQKLQSGISGELEPLRRLGYDLSVARLQEEAYTLGIQKKVSAMTQAEKSQLRYYAIMTQVTTAQGDMARTLNAPANQLRILQAQVTQCARALGNIFIPALNAVLPYATALVKVLRELANAIANLVGFKLPTVKYSKVSASTQALDNMSSSADKASASVQSIGGTSAGVQSVGDSANKASKGLSKVSKTAKKLKNALLGIDELNVLSYEDDSSSSKSSSGTGSGSSGVGGIGSTSGIGSDLGVSGSDLGIELPTYDFLGDAVSAKIDEIVEMIKGALWEIESAISVFALAIGTILVVTGVNIPLGIALMAVGAAGLATAVALNWKGMETRLGTVLAGIESGLGGFFLGIGAVLLFSGVNIPLGLGLMVLGAINLGTAVAINWKALKGNLDNALSIAEMAVGGAFLALGALFAFTGVDIPLGIGLMAIGAVKLATAVGLNWDKMPKSLKKIIGTIESTIGGALIVFGAILTLSGGMMPLGIAMIAAGAISLVSAVALNWNSINGNLKKSIKTIVSLLSGALFGIGAILALSGVGTVLGIALMATSLVGIVATAGLNWGSIGSKIAKVLKAIGITVGASLIALGVILSLSGVGLVIGIPLIAAGAASLVAGVVLNWGSIVDKIKGVLKKIGDFVGKNSIPIGLLLCMTGVGIPLGIGLIIAGVASRVTGVPLNRNTIVNTVKDVLNKVYTEAKKILGNLTKLLTPNSLVIGVQLVKDGWSTIKKWIGKIPGVKQLVALAKDAWSNVKEWVGDIPTLDQFIKLAKEKWSTVKKWIGKIPTLSQAIKLVKEKWTTIKNWIGHIPTLSQAIKLAREGWSKVSSWVWNFGKGVLEQGVKLAREGWSTVANWVKDKIGGTIDIGINLISKWKGNIKKFFGLSNGGSVSAGGGIKLFASGGVITPHMWKAMPKYANGMSKAHGSMFVAGESGAELVGHINGTTEVMNRFQLASIMRDSIASGMAQFSGYWQSMSHDLVTCANGIINAVIVSTGGINDNLVLASGSGYDPYNKLSQNVYEDARGNYDNSYKDDSWSRNMREFYREYVEPTLKEIASDTKRQADKTEQTIVQVGNRTINNAVTTQKQANGYNFIK